MAEKTVPTPPPAQRAGAEPASEGARGDARDPADARIARRVCRGLLAGGRLFLSHTLAMVGGS